MGLFSRVTLYARAHKFTSVVVVIIVLVSGYYGVKRVRGNTVPTRYVLAAVDKGSIITTVTGSGQISATNQVDVKSKANGDATSVPVKAGQVVKKGAILASLDARDAQKAVRDAQANLKSAQLALQKFIQPVDSYTLLQAQNSLESAKTTLQKLQLSQVSDYQKAQDTLRNAQSDSASTYEDSFNSITSAYVNMPTIATGLNAVLYGTDIGLAGQWNTNALINLSDPTDAVKLQPLQANAEQDYKTARAKYDVSFNDYKNLTRDSDRATIEGALAETLDTVRLIAQAEKSESNFLDAWSDYRSQHGWTAVQKAKDYQSSLSTYTGQTNSSLSSLLGVQKTLQSNKDAIVNAQVSLASMDKNNPLDLQAAQDAVKEREASLAKLKAGPESLDIQSQQLSVQQRQNSLQDAFEQLANASVRAPFDGVVAKVPIKVGDPISSGTVVVTLITQQQTAEISLNEVDVAKIAVGQKVTLTFDAIDGLSITGEVAEIDAIGTVTQGVVTYNVKMVFDTQDDRVKPGMSVSATIITNVKQDVLVVPNSAIKSQGNASYVEILDGATDTSSQGVTSADPPRQQMVQVGLSNDTSTEIVSGLSQGDTIVVRTIIPTTTTTAASAPSLFGAGGRVGGGGGGGAALRGAAAGR